MNSDNNIKYNENKETKITMFKKNLNLGQMIKESIDSLPQKEKKKISVINVVNKNNIDDILSNIRLEKRNEIELYISHKRCKQTIINIVNYVKYGFLLSSTILLFISTNLDKNENQKKNVIESLNITSGILNICVIFSDKIINECEHSIKNLKKKINYIINNFNDNNLNENEGE